MTDNNVLIVAFDGLDKDLIERYNCTNLMQDTFRTFDNETGMTGIKTPELFASFITGETHEQHGIAEMYIVGGGVWATLERRFFRKIPVVGPKTTGLRHTVFKEVNRIDFYSGFARREDLDDSIDTFLDPNGRDALCVPGYNPRTVSVTKLVKHHGIDEAEREAMKEFLMRRQELLNQVNTPREIFMGHFHIADLLQHLYAYDGIVNEPKISRIYEELDELAARIRQRAAFDTILFMSDHGLPTATEHNNRCFYSLNQNMTWGEPEITEFRSLIESEVSRTATATADDSPPSHGDTPMQNPDIQLDDVDT